VSRSVDACFFDLYGTLVDLAALDAACEAAAPGRGPMLAGRWRARQLEATWLRTVMGRWADFEVVTREALAVAADELALDGGKLALDLAGAWSRLSPRPGVHALLGRLDTAGVPLGILSNGAVAMIEATVDGAGLGGRFGRILSADHVRAFKPAPAVYRLATEATGMAADRIGFVTANGWDAVGAAAFGLIVLWLRPPGGSLPGVGPLDRPPMEVRLDEIATLIGA